jgi:hypothetical protein
MPARLRPDEYFVVTTSRGRPPVWTWEIQSRPKPIGVKLSGADFNSAPGAKLAGERALSEFLDRLDSEERNPI